MNFVDAITLKELILRLGVAALIGAALGLNRELHDKPAGLRTHALVTLGAAIATIAIHPQVGGGGPDPNALSRVIQGILTGVGFLGAGVILRDAGGHVTGLTTAATIWVCAALGIVCGCGYWDVVGVALGIVVIVLSFGRPVERVAERVFKRHRNGAPDRGI